MKIKQVFILPTCDVTCSITFKWYIMRTMSGFVMTTYGKLGPVMWQIYLPMPDWVSYDSTNPPTYARLSPLMILSIPTYARLSPLMTLPIPHLCQTESSYNSTNPPPMSSHDFINPHLCQTESSHDSINPHLCQTESSHDFTNPPPMPNWVIPWFLAYLYLYARLGILISLPMPDCVISYLYL